MKNRKTAKRALLLSALSLLMCVSMLVGSTFAWFTDSVTSAGNKIQAGTLQIDLQKLNKLNGAWESIKDNQDALFNYKLWEPGYTETVVLKVENQGSLALKWMAKLVAKDQLSALANVIDVYVLPSATEIGYPTGRDLTGYTKVGTVAEFVNTIEETTNGTLAPENTAGDEAYLGIALKMQESAGNEYQNMDLGEFDIQILATQYTYEEDSFDNQYDADAMYPVLEPNDGTFYVNNVAELNAELERIYTEYNAGATEKTYVIQLAGVEFPGNVEIKLFPTWNGEGGGGDSGNNLGNSGGISRFLNLHVIGQEGTKFTGNVKVHGFGYANGGFANVAGGIVFENITFDAANSADEDKAEDATAMYVLDAASNVTFKKCTFENASHVVLGASGNDKRVGNIIVDNCTFNNGGCLSGSFENLKVINTTVTAASNGFINNAMASTITVEGGTMNVGKYFLRTSSSGITATVKGATITMYESEGAMDLVKFRGSAESATFTGCTIAAGYTTAGVDANSVLTIN